MTIKSSNEQRDMFRDSLFHCSCDFFDVIKLTDDEKIRNEAKSLFLDRITKLLLWASKDPEVDIKTLFAVDKNGKLSIESNSETITITKQDVNFQLEHFGIVQINKNAQTMWKTDLRDELSEPINVVVTPENQNYQAISSLYSFGVNSRITELQSEIALLESSKEAPHDLMSQSEIITSNSSHRPLVKRSDK